MKKQDKCNINSQYLFITNGTYFSPLAALLVQNMNAKDIQLDTIVLIIDKCQNSISTWIIRIVKKAYWSFYQFDL